MSKTQIPQQEKAPVHPTLTNKPIPPVSPSKKPVFKRYWLGSVFAVMVISLSLFGLASCGSSDDPPPEPQFVKTKPQALVSNAAPVENESSVQESALPDAPAVAAPAETGADSPAQPSQPSQPAQVDEAVALVNGLPISKLVYDTRVQQFQQAELSKGFVFEGEAGQARAQQIHQQVLEGLIDQAIIEQNAARLGIQVGQDELQAMIDQMRQNQSEEEFNNWLVLNNFTYEDFERTLHDQLLATTLFEQIVSETPTQAEQVLAHQIVLPDLAMAQTIQGRLQTGEDFATLAQAFSIDEQTKLVGGALGWFPKGTQIVPPQIEVAVFSMSPGQLSSIIETVYGYHLVKLEDKSPSRPLAPEHLQLIQGVTFNNWLNQQRASAQIERFVN